MEPIVVTSTVADITVRIPNGAGFEAVLDASGSDTRISCSSGCMESIIANPTNSLTINLGTGGQTLTISAAAAGFNANVTVNGGSGADTIRFNAKTGTGAYVLNGGGGSDTIVGPDTDVHWDITGAGTGTAIDFTTIDQLFTFTSVQTLTGGSADDTFAFGAGATLTGGVDGGAGTDRCRAKTSTRSGSPRARAARRPERSRAPGGPDVFHGMERLVGGLHKDTLSFPSVHYTTVTDTFTGPGAGSVTNDGTTVTYSAFESVSELAIADDTHHLVFTAGDDGVRVTTSGGSGDLAVQPLTVGAFVLTEISAPGTKLSIETLAGNDTIYVDTIRSTFLARIDIDARRRQRRDRGRGSRSRRSRTSTWTEPPASTHSAISPSSRSRTSRTSRSTPTDCRRSRSRARARSTPASRRPSSCRPPVPCRRSPAHPFDSSVIYAGTVNGGIWLSTDSGVTWAPKTDGFPTLSIGAIAVLRATGSGPRHGRDAADELVVYAGTGSDQQLLRTQQPERRPPALRPTAATRGRSRAAEPAGPADHRYRALDTNNANPKRQTVVVTALGGVRNGGVFVSTTSGTAFTHVLGVSGDGRRRRPGRSRRVYAAVVGPGGGGVWRSDLRPRLRPDGPRSTTASI